MFRHFAVTRPVGRIARAVCGLLVDRLFTVAGEPPTFVFRSDDNPTIQGCVASGVGYWVTPLLTVDTDDPSVAVVPIEPAPEPRRIALAWSPSRHTSPAVDTFIAVAEEVCREVSQRSALALAQGTV